MENLEAQQKEYELLKMYAMFLNLPKAEFLQNIEDKTALGCRFWNFFERYCAGNEQAELDEFVKIMYADRDLVLEAKCGMGKLIKGVDEARLEAIECAEAQIDRLQQK